jgi:glycosyltransferase involved in cell wall biosynthesis
MLTALFNALEPKGIDLALLAGVAGGDQAIRHDDARLDFQRTVRSFGVSVRGRSIRLKPVQRAVRGADLVISELGSGALESYLLSFRRGIKHAVWGHAYSATTKPNRLDATLERWLMRRSDRVFVYTARGREAALGAGVPDDQITVLNNSIDTRSLAAARARVTDDEVRCFRSRCELGDGPLAAFIGGLDSSKRLGFLIAAGEKLATAVDGFHLVVAGDGAQRERVEAAAAEFPWLRYVGRADDDMKALIGATASVLLNPGRVGLISVDSFALATPIATTRWALHAPEFDYLVDGENALVTDDSIDAYVAGVTALLTDDARAERLRHGCEAAAERYSLEAMVERFVDGIMRTLG